MSAAFDHREPGTLEADWAAASPWRGAPDFALAADRLIVLAAHPDDETLGAGGLLTQAAAAGIPTTVVLVTDGERSHPTHPDPAHLAEQRRAEFIAAMSVLAPRASLVLLGVADGGIREARAEVTESVVAIVRRGSARRTLIAAPWWGDGHRDHRVLGEVALALRGGGVRVAGYPIWMWHWADPDVVDTSSWHVLSMSEADHERKQRAIAAYRSQLEPDPRRPRDGALLHRETLAHFARDIEIFVMADAATAADRTIADFDAFHARHDDPWGLESRWYERRKRQLLLASLPRERFERALELGSASGATTRELAERSVSVIGVDASAVAIERARRRGVPDGVAYQLRELPDDWPDGEFDLIVLSELAYYWSPERLARALDRIDACTTDDAVLVVCHWRRPIEGASQSGDDVHAVLGTRRGWRFLARHTEEDFLLDVLVRPGMASVATEGGLA